MICQKCQQAPATIHLKSLKACRQIESHYCEPCSRTLDLGYPVSPAPPPPPPSRSPSKRNGLFCAVGGILPMRPPYGEGMG